MRRSVWSLIMISCTLAFTIIAFAEKKEVTTPARIVQVQRGNVRRTVALTGTVTYADEEYAIAPMSGIVSQICVKAEDRVAAGEAIVRMESAETDAVMTAYAMGQDLLEQFGDRVEKMVQRNGSSVVRAQKTCTVRQMLVKEGSVVSAGMPVARLSSNEQKIVCLAQEADAELLSGGMWAWIFHGEEEIGYAILRSIKDSGVDALTGLRSYEVILQPQQTLAQTEGAALELEVYLAGCDDTMTLPVEAVTDRGTVWWVNNDGKCTEIPAGLIMSDEIRAWVGLPEGTRVAVGEFKEGQHVREAEK